MILLRALSFDDRPHVVDGWYADYERHEDVRAELDVVMLYLRQQAREGWIRPRYDILRDGVGEVRFKVNRIHYRPLGFFGPARNEFTFLCFAKKKKEYEPRNAIDVAAALRGVVESDPARSVVIIDRWGQ